MLPQEIYVHEMMSDYIVTCNLMSALELYNSSTFALSLIHFIKELMGSVCIYLPCLKVINKKIMAGYFHQDVSFLRLLRLQNKSKIALYIFGYRL